MADEKSRAFVDGVRIATTRDNLIDGEIVLPTSFDELGAEHQQEGIQYRSSPRAQVPPTPRIAATGPACGIPQSKTLGRDRGLHLRYPNPTVLRTGRLRIVSPMNFAIVRENP